MDKATTPRVSVVVPAYNAAAYLERALESALAQTMPDLEVIVVDDASSDATLALAREIGARDSRVRVLHNERNAGAPATYNRAIGAARGEWIAMLETDDAWSAERLERMLDLADSVDVVSDDLQIVGSLPIIPGAKSVTLLLRQRLNVTAPHPLDILEFVHHDLGSLKPIIRRSFLQQHGLEFNPGLRFTPDFHFYFEMLASGARWLQLPSAYYFYYWHGSNTSSNNLEVAQNVLESTESLLHHPAVAEDPALAAALEQRMQEWKSNRAFAVVWELLRQRRGVELARLLLKEPSYHSLIVRKISRALYRRLLLAVAILSLYRGGTVGNTPGNRYCWPIPQRHRIL